MSVRGEDVRVRKVPEGEGTPPESPYQIPARGWRATLKRTVQETREDRVSLIAAGVAFFWFLAVFPLLIAAVGILGIVNATPSLVRGINEGIRTALPGDAARVLSDAVTAAQGRGRGSLIAAIAGIALAIWSASSGMAAAQVGLDVAYDVPRDRPWLKKRLMAIVLILLALLLGGIATALLVFGRPLGEYLADVLPWGGEVFLPVWNAVRWVITVLAVVTLFALFYFIGPNREPPSWKWLSPGGIVGTLIWLAASLGFSFYVSSFGGSYGETYGSLAGVVILVLWLYLSALALLLGAELNGELERERALRDPASSAPGVPPEEGPAPAAT